MNISIIGCGLIGSSIAMALKTKRKECHITGIVRENRISITRESRIFNEVGTLDKLTASIEKSDIVIIATPVETIIPSIKAIAKYLKNGAVVTDVGSTKKEIVEKANNIIPTNIHFIGGHPIAGSEQKGVDFADPLLFKDRVYALCPAPETPPEALLSLIDIVEDLHAVPITIEPAEHDSVMAMLSHVPQLISIALVHAAMKDDATHMLLNIMAGQGFLDLTRIAASDYNIWHSILETNKTSTVNSLESFSKSILKVAKALESGQLQPIWDKVSKKRRSMTVQTYPKLRKPDIRKLIDQCDEQLLRALGNRLQLVGKMAQLKKTTGASVYDPDRERRLLKERINWSESFNIPSSLTKEIFDCIVNHSKKIQEEKIEKDEA